MAAAAGGAQDPKSGGELGMAVDISIAGTLDRSPQRPAPSSSCVGGRLSDSCAPGRARGDFIQAGNAPCAEAFLHYAFAGGGA